MLQSFSGPKLPNTHGFCFTRRCWSCTSPGALRSWAVTRRSPFGHCSGSGRPRRGGCTTAAFRAGRGTAGARKVEVVSGGGSVALPHSVRASPRSLVPPERL